MTQPTPPPGLKSLGQLPSCPTWAQHLPSCTEVPCAASSDLMLPRATAPSVPCQLGCFGLLSEDTRRPRFNRKVPIALFSVSLVLFPTTCALSAINRGARRGGSCESHTAVRVPFVSCVPFGDGYAFGDAPQWIGVCIMIRDLISYGTCRKLAASRSRAVLYAPLLHSATFTDKPQRLCWKLRVPLMTMG